MLLAIDIGNTNLVIGCIENDKILFKARIATDAIRTSDQYGVEIKNMMEAFGVQVKDIDDCIISSVVPPVFNSVKTGVIKVIRKQPMVVGPGLKTGLNIHHGCSQSGGQRPHCHRRGRPRRVRSAHDSDGLGDGNHHRGGGAEQYVSGRHHFPGLSGSRWTR